MNFEFICYEAFFNVFCLRYLLVLLSKLKSSFLFHYYCSVQQSHNLKLLKSFSIFNFLSFWKFLFCTFYDQTSNISISLIRCTVKVWGFLCFLTFFCFNLLYSGIALENLLLLTFSLQKNPFMSSNFRHNFTIFNLLFSLNYTQSIFVF